MYNSSIRKIVVPVLIMVCCIKAHAVTAESILPNEKGKNTSSKAAPLWRQAPGGKLLGIPSIQVGIVVAVLDGGNLKAYSLDGKHLWDYYPRGKVLPFVSRSREGTSYICRTDGNLIAVNRIGRELWRQRIGPITAPVVSGWDGSIFAVTEKKVFCYTASGYLLWSKDLKRPLVSGPFLTNKGGIVMALDKGELWELCPFGAEQIRSMGDTPAEIITMDNGILALFKKGPVKLFPAKSSEPAREVLSFRSFPLGGASRGTNAAIVLSNGQVACVSLSNNKILWTEASHIKNNEIKSSSDFSLIWDERGIYVSTRRGTTAFNTEGKRLWTLSLSGISSIPVLGDNGTLFSGGDDWIIYAYKVEDRVLPQRLSLYGPEPQGNYGLGNAKLEIILPFNETLMDEEIKKITDLIQSGSIGEKELYYTAFLREIASAAALPKTSITRPPVHVRHRATAAQILGYFASQEAIPFLADLFLKESDSTVRVAIAHAIGRIGTDPEGIALNAFNRAINAARRDDQVLIAVASAIGSLCRFSGPPLSEAGIKMLGSLSSSSMPANVRTQALLELQKMAK